MGQAVIIGAIGGIICMYGMKLLDMLKIDDVVGAIPAHLFAGIWGTLVVAWTNPDASFKVQLIGSFIRDICTSCKLHCLVHY